MFRFLAAWTLVALMSCATTKESINDPEKTNEVLISFISKAQAGFWDDAMDYITYEERVQMMDREQVKPEYEAAINRVRLSALTKIPFTLDRKGRLVGIKAVLDESNKRYTTSDQQRNVNLSELEKARSERINKLREEGQRILEEQRSSGQEPSEEVLTNRLTDEDRRRLSGSAAEEEGSWQEGTSAPVPSESESSVEQKQTDKADQGDEWH